ncbi:MAG: glycerophosphodiester phosphodiesterase [Deltaproteobacteria bacterium]|nr:glycerophosphodiester phosphodiesterase [Deltaproteobacteria bacterium]
MNEFLCFAHRGASGHEPENTLSAVETAITLGADWIEIDVYLVEKELVVFHDQRLERTTNGTGPIMEQSLEYIRSLDAGNGESIPILREVLDLVNHRAGINIELKGFGTADETVSLIHEYTTKKNWMYEEFLISSFNHHELARVKYLDPLIMTGALVVGIPIDYARFAEGLGAYSVHCNLDFINEAFVQDAHERGLKVFVFTVNNRHDLARMKALSVDGIFTNNPEIVTSRLKP